MLNIKLRAYSKSRDFLQKIKNGRIAPAVLTKLSFDRNVNSEFPNNNNKSNYRHFLPPQKLERGKTAPILIKVLTFMQKQAILNTGIELRMV